MDENRCLGDGSKFSRRPQNLTISSYSSDSSGKFTGDLSLCTQILTHAHLRLWCCENVFEDVHGDPWWGSDASRIYTMWMIAGG